MKISLFAILAAPILATAIKSEMAATDMKAVFPSTPAYEEQ